MRRILAIMLAALVLSVGPLSAPAQSAPERPSCANITGNSGNSFYQVDPPGYPTHEAILFVRITTLDPLCKFASLTVFVTVDGTNFTQYTFPGDTRFASCGVNCLSFTFDYGPTATAPSNAPPIVYVYLETAIGNHVVDRAPSVGTVRFILCDHNASTPDYDSNGTLIAECTPPEAGEGFQ